MFYYNNQLNNDLYLNSFEANCEDFLFFNQNNNLSLDENNDEEENIKIYKDYNINNSISEFNTKEKTPNIIDINHSNTFDINLNQKKKLGRKRKNSTEQSNNRNKFSKDNLIHKFKTIFYQKFLIVLINNLIFSSGLGKDFKIRKVSNDYIKDLKININLDILNKTIAEYFSLIYQKYIKIKKKI